MAEERDKKGIQRNYETAERNTMRAGTRMNYSIRIEEFPSSGPNSLNMQINKEEIEWKTVV